MMQRCVFFICVLFWSCDDRITGPVAVFDQPFWLQAGKAKIVQPSDLQLSFNEVISDGRCPLGLACFIGGEAEVDLTFQSADFDSTGIRLVIDAYVTREDTLLHHFTDVFGHRITLMELFPHPHVDIRSQLIDYRALIRVTKL